MSLNIKYSGSWREATEVHIKDGGSWQQCKEVYIKKDGTWEHVLYSLSTNTIASTGTGTITVPKGAFRAVITIIGADGGTGGGDGGHGGTSGGNGASLTATVNVDPFTTLSYNIGTIGGNGQGHASSASGGSGGNGYASGGGGGTAGGTGSSGGGVGGGGATSIVSSDGTVIMVAGGGGGGGGRGNRAQLSASDRNGKDSTKIISDIGLIGASNGGNGVNCGTSDGGAGGGGGGGVSGASNTTKSYNADSWGYAYSTTSTNFSSISDMHVASKRSSSACTEGYSFGITGTSIWVDHGCRATFNVVGTDGSAGAGGAYQGSYDSDGYGGSAGISYYNSDLISGQPSLSATASAITTYTAPTAIVKNDIVSTWTAPEDGTITVTVSGNSNLKPSTGCQSTGCTTCSSGNFWGSSTSSFVPTSGFGSTVSAVGGRFENNSCGDCGHNAGAGGTGCNYGTQQSLGTSNTTTYSVSAGDTATVTIAKSYYGTAGSGYDAGGYGSDYPTVVVSYTVGNVSVTWLPE